MMLVAWCDHGTLSWLLAATMGGRGCVCVCVCACMYSQLYGSPQRQRTFTMQFIILPMSEIQFHPQPSEGTYPGPWLVLGLKKPTTPCV